MTTALIIDPGLAAVQGHNYGAWLRISAELSRLDIKHACLASIQADATVRKHGAPVLPKKGLWWRSDGTREEFLAHAVQMARALCFAFDEQETWPDLLVFPCCDAVQVQALVMALRLRRRLPTPHIVMWILMPDFLEEYGEAFAALKEVVGDEGKIAVYCETAALAAALRSRIGLEVGVVPGANVAGADGKDRKRSGNAAPNLVAMGMGNMAKGYDLFPGALERVLQSNADVTFWIHGVVASDEQAPCRPVFDRLSKMDRRVQASSAVLTPEEYLAHLLRADLLLLPYDEKIYRMRGSGLFNEARELGIPVVATRGCSFAQPAFDQGWGVEIAERSPSGVAEAILTAVSRLPELTDRAAEAAKLGNDSIATVLRRAVEKMGHREEGAGASKEAAPVLLVAQPLPTPPFSKVILSNGAVLRGDSPVALQRLISWLPVRAQLSVLTSSVVGTSAAPYHYSVLLDVDRAATRRMEPGSLLIVEVFIEVLVGTVGIVWIDRLGQPVQDSERYAVEIPAAQRVVISIPSEHAHCLVFRNAASGAMGASFKVRRLSFSTIAEPEAWRLGASDHAC